MSEEKRHYRTCNFCEAICGIEVTYQDKQIIAIKGDKNDPFSRGHICPKAVALKDLYEDPDRIRVPMERTAEGWKALSWEEALDKAAAGIKQVQQQAGRDAMAVYLGNPNVHNTGNMVMIKTLLKAIGSKSKYSATSVDQLPHHIVAHHLFGHQLQIPVPDIDRTAYMIVLGGNPAASNGSIMTVPDVKKRLKAIRQRKGKVVVIDPRFTETSELASEHLFVRPGTDVLLLLSMIHVLFSEGLVNPGKLAEYTPGFEALEGWVEHYPPQRVAAITGISAADIERLVREFCAAESGVLYGRMGVSVQQFGLLCQYLVMLFNLLTGRIDSEGGMMFPKPAINVLGNVGPGHFGGRFSRVRKVPAFSGELPVSTLAEDMLEPGEGQLKGLVTVAGNPVLSTPNGAQLAEALSGLDFMVSIDFNINETTRHANIILPPVSPLEREHYDISFHALAVRNTAKYADALFEPEGEEKHDWQIFMALEERLKPAKSMVQKAQRLALKQLGPKALLDVMLRTGPYGEGAKIWKGLSLRELRNHPHGIDLGALQPQLPQALYHRDKTIHLQLDFYQPDLERVEQTFFSESYDARKPLLIGRRHVRDNNSWMHNSRRLVKGKSRCTVMLHSEHAAELGVVSGDQVQVASRVGTLIVEAEVTDKIMPGVVSIPHGWGHDYEHTSQKTAKKHAGVSVNDLTDESALDELSGNAVLNGVPVTLTAV